MKQKIFWFDLAVCCLWALGVLGNRTLWFAHPMMWIVALFVVSRIVLSFALYMGEKKAWVSGVMFVLLTGIVACFGLKPVVGDLTSKLFPMLGLEFNDRCFTAFNIGLTVWLWITPLTVLVVNALRKGRLVDTLSWAEACGKLLWTDKRAKTYGSLLLVAVGTMYAGLAMDARLCLFACVVAPTFTLCVLNRYCGITNGRVWIMVVALLIFFFAQTHAGLLRMSMLGVSFCMVAYVCGRFYSKRKMLVLAVLSTTGLGVLLPSLAIGNNQYTCFNVGRTGFYSLYSHPGIFIVENKATKMVGLRDRYGLLVKPEYESVVYHTPYRWSVELELQRNGYYTLYNIYKNACTVDNHINHSLQDNICPVVEAHLSAYRYQFDDRLEVTVLEASTHRTITHIKALKNGSVIYDYGNAPYIPTDSVASVAKPMVRDTSVHFEWCKKQSLSCLQSVNARGAKAYIVQVTLARDKMPQPQEAQNLIGRVAKVLKKL